MVILMSKTEEIVKALEEGKTVKEIKEAGLGSQALIYRVKAKYDAKKKELAESSVSEDPEPTDDEIDNIISKICIKPDEKYLTKAKQEKEEEEYHCMGCDHRWKASEMPLSCPKCGVEFE
jgi:rubrerythrin